MSEIDDQVRALLKLPAGVVLSDEERSRALDLTDDDRFKASIIKDRVQRDMAAMKRNPSGPRKFGGIR